jgi:hypothetical protein
VHLVDEQDDLAFRGRDLAQHAHHFSANHRQLALLLLFGVCVELYLYELETVALYVIKDTKLLRSRVAANLYHHSVLFKWPYPIYVYCILYFPNTKYTRNFICQLIEF